MKNIETLKAQYPVLQMMLDSDALLQGHFILSSGLHSAVYLQCAKLLQNPARSEKVAQMLAEKIKAHKNYDDIDLVISPAMGGLIIGHEVAKALGKDFFFVERVEGHFQLRRGFEIKKGSKVLVVEDVITTGKSSIETFECIKEHGAEPIIEACIIDRCCDRVNLGIDIISLATIMIEVYESEHLPEELKQIEPVKPGSRFIKK